MISIFEPELTQENPIERISSSNVHYLKNVLRVQVGDMVFIKNGNGIVQRSKILSLTPKSVGFSVAEMKFYPKESHNISIAFGLLKKGEKNELIVEKLTELGIKNMYILLSENVERRIINLERLEKISISAMLQSQRHSLPKIKLVENFTEFCHEKNGFIAHCNKDFKAKPLSSFSGIESEMTYLVGPEGDFSPKEIEIAFENGFQGISLGQNRLRSETAVLFLSSVLVSKTL